MKTRKFWVLLWAALLVGGAAGCGDDDTQPGNNNNHQLQPDAEVPDAEVPDAAIPDAEVPDAAPATGCTGAPATSPQPMGACCTDDSECADGACIGGFCSLAGCTDDVDCDPTVPGAFPGGTPMGCNRNSFGFVSFCAPGSLQDCGAAGDSPCPDGEVCVLGWNDDAVTQNDGALRGVCMTRVHGQNVGATGDPCDEHADPGSYQCEAPSYLLESCVGRRCTEACDPANPTNLCPADMECVGPLAFATNAGVLSGGGLCGGSLCGMIQATGDPETDVAIPGVDSECPAGQVCVPAFFTGMHGETFEFRCEPATPGYGAPGDTCEQAEKFGQFCNHGTLCLQQQPTWRPTGTLCSDDADCGPDEVCASRTSFPNRCAPKPDPGFCSKGCRTDADCADLPTTAYCVELRQDYPNGQQGFLTVCYPEAELFASPPTPCTSNADCDASRGEGCLLLSNHSSATVCGVAVTPDATGTDCTSAGPGACSATEACVENEATATSFCTDVQALGDPCDPADHQCLGGLCLDGELATDDGGSPTHTYCSGLCRTSSDCGPLQVCEPVLLAENDPAVDTDDVVLGICRTQRVRSGAGCTGDSDCTAAATGDTCDVSTGRCHTAASTWGAPCASHSDCPLGGFCNTDVPGGLCYLPGCDPAAGGADCGGGAACSTEGPVAICLEGCAQTSDCARAGEGFTCISGACVAP